ncbi:hypothetical protein SAMN04489729_3994 [Amycolatopsis lurida]|nr:hypothetical protein SAMN04489729_3994 [Amycolatopsis lurida]
MMSRPARFRDGRMAVVRPGDVGHNRLVET